MKPSDRDEQHARYRRAQRMAYDAAQRVFATLEPGMNEAEAAHALEHELRRQGVRAFFHEPFVWFGSRTCFAGVRRKRYHQFFSRKDIVLTREDEVILDVAPIIDGAVVDIGYSNALVPTPQYIRAREFLKQLRQWIPTLIGAHRHEDRFIYQAVDECIRNHGYDNVHAIYPFHVLGHRVDDVPLSHWSLATPLKFSLHSFYQILRQQLWPALLHPKHGPLRPGLWAIEPHFGWQTGGIKFEELLLIDEDEVRWLDPHSFLHEPVGRLFNNLETTAGGTS